MIARLYLIRIFYLYYVVLTIGLVLKNITGRKLTFSYFVYVQYKGFLSEHLQTRLDDYVNKHLPKVKVIRACERLGLIRARLLGLKFASAQVVLYLDSHCECTEGLYKVLNSANAEFFQVNIKIQ